jgi:hypothetical protein
MLQAQPGEMKVVEPSYPANAFQGGTVVASLELKGGLVSSVNVLSGSAPFVETATAALRQWRFPRDREDRPALVVINFRGPNLYAQGSAAQDVQAKSGPASAPTLKTIVEPGYPPNSMGQGGVVLQFKVTSKGEVAGTKVLKELGGLTQACSDAVKKWKLNPAKDSTAGSGDSDAFAVCVFRQPVLGRQD